MPFTTTGGFTPKTTDEIRTELEAAFLTNVDAALDLSADQPMGQIIAIAAEREAALWELLAVAYDAFDRDKAEFYLLDSLGALTGTTRKYASKTLIQNAQVTLTAGTTLAAGAQASVQGYPEYVFASTDSVTNSAAYTRAVSVDFECLTEGPISVNPNTLNVIAVAQTGWVSVNNDDQIYPPAATVIGSDVETDAAFRARQKAELPGSGGSSTDAMRAKLIAFLAENVPGDITQAFVFENTGGVVDSAGLPAHSFEAVIYDGPSPVVENTDVGQIIWDNKPAGIQIYGTTTTTATDSSSVVRTVYFSRAQVSPVWIDITVLKTNQFPTNGIDLVKQAIVDAMAGVTLGDWVYSLPIKAAALEVTGVKNVTAYAQGLDPSPTLDATIEVTGRQIATFSTSNINVYVTGV